jgi:alpha-beta hydrolase superfamily lysophospholipase
MTRQHTTGHWETNDGLRLFWQSWTPADPPRGLLGIVHGMGEHSGRYAESAAYFNGIGFAVLAFDHRGHGQSEGPRGHAPSYQALLDGIDGLLEEAASWHPTLPVYLWGHSMGGNLVLNHLLRRKPDIQGAVITAPWLRLALQPKAFQVMLAKAMNVLYPAYTDNSKLPPEYISRDPEAVERYKNDPLVHYSITARMFLACHNMGQFALEHAGELKTPVLVMHGSGDKLTSVEGSRIFAKHAPKDLCTYTEYDGWYHELHNEPEKLEALTAMADWMAERAIEAGV